MSPVSVVFFSMLFKPEGMRIGARFSMLGSAVWYLSEPARDDRLLYPSRILSWLMDRRAPSTFAAIPIESIWEPAPAGSFGFEC